MSGQASGKRKRDEDIVSISSSSSDVEIIGEEKGDDSVEELFTEIATPEENRRTLRRRTEAQSSPEMLQQQSPRVYQDIQRMLSHFIALEERAERALRRRRESGRRGRGRGGRRRRDQRVLFDLPMWSPSVELERFSYQDMLAMAQQEGEHGRRGASKQELDQLPTEQYSIPKSASKTNKSEVESCNICMEDLADGHEMRRLPCFHTFHKHCIDRWLQINKVCPICRRSIDQ